VLEVLFSRMHPKRDAAVTKQKACLRWVYFYLKKASGPVHASLRAWANKRFTA
jgi:hypothetical protein